MDLTKLEAAAPRRILYIVNEDFAFLLNRLPMARATRKAGFEVHVATHVNDGADSIQAEGFVLHPIPLQRGGLSPLAAISAIVALRRVERQIKPHIVHHSGLQCSVFGSIAAFGLKFPQINAMTGLGYVFTSVSSRTRLLRALLKWLLPLLFNRPGCVVLVQNPDDRSALVDLGIERTRMVLVPGSGVDTDAMQPLPEPDGPITFGFAGRLLTDKGIRALVAAHSIVRSQGYDVNLIIAGNPDPANPASVSMEEVRGVVPTARNYVAGAHRRYRIVMAKVPFCRLAITSGGPARKPAGSGRLRKIDDRDGCAGLSRDRHSGPNRTAGPNRRSAGSRSGDRETCDFTRAAHTIRQSGAGIGRQQAFCNDHRKLNRPPL